MRQKYILGFTPILILLIIVSLGIVGYFAYKNRITNTTTTNVSNTTPTPTKKPNISNHYVNNKYNFSISFPNELEVPESNTDYGYFGDKIYFSVSEYDPLGCRGDCPLIEKVFKDVSIAGLKATKIEGYFGEIGGNIAQHYIEYVLVKNNKYYIFTQNALGKNINVTDYYKNLTTENSNPKVSDADRKMFDQILSTFKFSPLQLSTEGQSCGILAGSAGNAMCAAGLTCEFKNKGNPYEIGVCVE